MNRDYPRLFPWIAAAALAAQLRPAPGSAEAVQGPTVQPGDVAIDEKLGSEIPLDLSFRDEEGGEVALRSLVDGPTVLALVYYHCPSICTPLLSGIAEVVDRMEGEPGKEYRILAVSFDERDTPEIAAEKKKSVLSSMKRQVPAEAFRFLTASPESIARIADSVGFRFRREGDGFTHTAALIVLSPKGKITRYLYGITFLPFDLKLALLEASEGRTGPTIAKVLLYCFRYDSQSRKYVLDILKVWGSLTMVFVVAFVIFLTRKGKPQAGKLLPGSPG